jgi:hypothetical protein
MGILASLGYTLYCGETGVAKEALIQLRLHDDVDVHAAMKTLLTFAEGALLDTVAPAPGSSLS